MGEKTALTPSPPRCYRVVFDTNIVVSALIFGGRLAWLRHAWSRGDVVPVVCRETADELLRVLQYPKFRLTAEDRSALLGDYLPFAEVAALPDALPPLDVACRDRDDVIFIQLARAAGADFLVSGDTDLTSIAEMLPVTMISAETLRSLVEAR